MEYLILFALLIFMLSFYFRFINFLKAIFFGAISGLLAFSVFGYFFPQYINLSIFSILMATIAGIPGVLSIVLANCINF